jgi:hypothetical protein
MVDTRLRRTRDPPPAEHLPPPPSGVSAGRAGDTAMAPRGRGTTRGADGTLGGDRGRHEGGRSVSRTAPRTLPLPSGEPVPVLGQGTWGWAEDPRRRPDELAALRLGLDLGATLVDTAEIRRHRGGVRGAGTGRPDLRQPPVPRHDARRAPLPRCGRRPEQGRGLPADRDGRHDHDAPCPGRWRSSRRSTSPPPAQAGRGSWISSPRSRTPTASPAVRPRGPLGHAAGTVAAMNPPDRPRRSSRTLREPDRPEDSSPAWVER